MQSAFCTTHEQPMISLLRFWCKIWVPWTFSALSKKLLEMGIKQKPSWAEKIFHHEYFRWSISNYSGAFPASYTCCRRQPPGQTLNTPCQHHPDPQHSPGAPRLLSSPGTQAREGCKYPQGSPGAFGLETACRDQALQPWVGLVRDIPATSEITLGLFWLHVFTLCNGHLQHCANKKYPAECFPTAVNRRLPGHDK